jgi:benzoate/toluate 1,2-dioxygenase beta subunit
MSQPQGAVPVLSRANPQFADAVSDDEIRKFVYRESRLLDEGRIEDWLAIWAPDARYWVPSSGDDLSLDRVQLILDDRDRLEERVYRLTHADAHAQEPRSQTTHLVSGVEIDRASAADVVVHAALVIVELRHEVQQIYAGRVRYTVRASSDRLELVEKRVLLTRNSEVLGNMTFLI